MVRGSIPPGGSTKGIYMNKVKTKLLCTKCGHSFSAKGGNFKKHYTKCDGTYTPFKKSTNCKHCGIDFSEDMTASERANHVRWCSENPKRETYNKDLSFARSCITEDARERNRKSIARAHAEGKYKDSAKKAAKTRIKNGTHLHTEETKKVLREKALASPHRRLKKGVIEYHGILLDSSWELELAKRLDELEIEWVRPDPIPWIDEEGVTHNYFPDFYLKDYDLFLDPKNPQAVRVQKKKLDCLLKQYSNIVILETIEDCKTYLP
mgnify:CR=1 FL=1